MASNYWDSTQAKFWTFSKSELNEIRKDLEKANQPLCSKYAVPDRRHICIYFQTQMAKLGRRLQVRQQALATAQVYVKRYYLKVEMRRTNPYLIMATAVYLACKAEECPQHIRLVLGEAARQWPELGITEASKIGECEFFLISTLSSQLICHHPYRPLSDFGPLFGLNADEQQAASHIINDSFNTDLSLLHPPHVLAITSIFLVLAPKVGPNANAQSHPSISSPTQLASPSVLSSASAISPLLSPGAHATSAQQMLNGYSSSHQSRYKLSKLVDWVAESKIDMSAVVDATQEIVSLYEAWESFSERVCKESITKFMKEGSGLGLKLGS